MCDHLLLYQFIILIHSPSEDFWESWCLSPDVCLFKTVFLVKYVKLYHPDEIIPKLQIIGVPAGVFFALPIFIKFPHGRYKNSFLIGTDLQIYWTQTGQYKLDLLLSRKKAIEPEWIPV